MGRPPAARSRATRAVATDLASTFIALGACVPTVQTGGERRRGRAARGHQADMTVGLSGGTARPPRHSPATCSGPQSASLRGPEPWPATRQRPPALSMQRVRSNTRLGTLIVTTVPVTALGVVVGMGRRGVARGLRSRGARARARARRDARGRDRSGGRAGHGRDVHTFGVRALLARAAHETRPALAGVDVRVDVAPARLRTVGDPECLHRAVADLIVHAARRSPPGGMVTLAARSAPHGVRLEVRDEGSGDCGASLTQARRIVGRHGGELRAERGAPARLPRGRRAARRLSPSSSATP